MNGVYVGEITSIGSTSLETIMLRYKVGSHCYIKAFCASG
jgi:hypothetical protein